MMYTIDPKAIEMLPEGSYPVFIEKITMETGKNNPDYVYAKIEFKVSGSPVKSHEGKKIKANVGLKSAMFLNLLRAVKFEIPDGTFQVDPVAILGEKSLTVEVSHREYEKDNGQKGKTTDVVGFQPVQEQIYYDQVQADELTLDDFS